MKHPSVLIVGAGLAGICVARRLHEKNIDFQVMDSGINESSVIAAGVINPLVFRRMLKSWRVDALLPEAVRFYAELEQLWNNTYYHSLPVRRAFAHQQEYDFWVEKQQLPEFTPYMKTLDEADHAYAKVNNTFGTGKVLQSAFVSAARLIGDAQDWLKQENRLSTEVFDHALLDPKTGTYKGVTYDHIVFCEGFRGLENPWFRYLPLQATKGEILVVKSEELPEDELLNRKCFILPIGQQEFKIGATYSWDQPNTDFTEEAREMLTEQAHALTNSEVEFIRQEAGVRPTVEDRRPLMGKHPEFEKIAIFNGLGSKGYMMAPLLSLEFVEHLLNGQAIDPEADINRFQKKYRLSIQSGSK